MAPEEGTVDTEDFLVECHIHKDAGELHKERNVFSRFKDSRKSWKKRREPTVTNGQHVGHFQAAGKHNHLSWIFIQRGDIPAITGYTPLLYRQYLDLMIFRKHSYMNYVHNVL